MQVTSKISTGKVFTFDFDALPPASQKALIEYGAQRWINDRVNSTKKSKGLESVEDINGLGEDMLKRLLEGNVGTVRREAVDPFTSHQIRYVQEILREHKGMTFAKSKKLIAAKGLEAFKEQIGADLIEKEAHKRMEREKGLDIDLGDLLSDIE